VVHRRVDANLSTAPATVTLRLDGAVVVDALALDGAFKPGTLRVMAPLPYVTGPTQPWVVRIDNLVLDYP
jgi:hypothetical protein